MSSSTITSKGQTTIPKDVRENLGLKAGETITYTVLPTGVVIMRTKTRSLDDVAGMLHREGQSALPVELLSR